MTSPARTAAAFAIALAIASPAAAQPTDANELHAKMRLAVGDFFTVSFDGPPESTLADAVIEVLNRAYWRIGDVFGTYPVRSVPVVLYTREQFRDVTRAPVWAAGVFDGSIRIPVRGALDSVKGLERVLAHEFTHALIHSIAPRGVPTWLNEGLAAALEREDIAWAEQRLAKSGAMPLRELQRSFGRFNGDDAERAYATSATAAKRLLDEAGGAPVANLLRDLAAGVKFEEAFLHRIQRSFTDFESSLR
jgi:hypothetical protein